MAFLETVFQPAGLQTREISSAVARWALYMCSIGEQQCMLLNSRSCSVLPIVH